MRVAVKKHNPHPYFNDSDRLHQFSQRLLGRVMFLYFLQKKEFLAGDRRFLTTQYQCLRPNPDETDYYAAVLEPLFFETLNTPRQNIESRWGKIPYLNGGLFDRDYGAGIRDAAGRETPETITLPNSLFDPCSSDGLLGFFNSYNFTVSENVAGDEMSRLTRKCWVKCLRICWLLRNGTKWYVLHSQRHCPIYVR
jgi:hypothetical protein